MPLSALVKKLNDPHDKYTMGDTVQDSCHALVITWRIGACDASIALIKKTRQLTMHASSTKRLLLNPILGRK
jgi:hypothetical protein